MRTQEQECGGLFVIMQIYFMWKENFNLFMYVIYIYVKHVVENIEVSIYTSLCKVNL